MSSNAVGGNLPAILSEDEKPGLLNRFLPGLRHGSIVQRILWLLVLWGVFIYLLSVIGIWWGSKQVIEDSFENKAIEWARTLDELGTPLYASDDQQLFNPIEEHVARFPELAYLRYYRADDYSVIGEYVSAQLPGNDVPRLSEEHFSELQEKVNSNKPILIDTFDGSLSLMRASAPIVIRSIESDGLIDFNLVDAAEAESYKIIGYVELGLDFGIYRQKLLHNILLGSAVMAVILFVAILVGRILLKRSLGALTGLSEPLQRLAAGDTEVRVRGSGDQEIDAIANALNTTIAALRDRDEKLRRLADRDPLTGLLNKKSFNELLEQELKRVGNSDDSSALIFIDLDKFKYINDSFGHAAGDRLLSQVANMLEEQMRPNDVLARFGGDEFMVIARSVSEQEAESLAQAIVSGMQDVVFVAHDKPLKIYCSLGVALINPGDTSIEDVFTRADLACFDAKSAGRNGYHIYDDGTITQSKKEEEISWSKTLGEALEADAFQLKFQPIVGLADADGEFYEVKLQLPLQKKEIVDSNVFFPEAERLGLCDDVGHWLIRNAFEKLEANATGSRDIRLIVNLPGHYFGMSTLVDHIAEAVKAHQVNSSNVVFQVPEQTAITQYERTRQQMKTLAGIGFRFALGEFGSGSQSFAYLKGLPVDFLRIDCHCYADEKSDSIERLTAEYLVGVARALGKSVIGDSVANAKILDAVRAAGVDYAQGNHIGKPRVTIPASSYERLVSKYSKVA